MVVLFAIGPEASDCICLARLSWRGRAGEFTARASVNLASLLARALTLAASWAGRRELGRGAASPAVTERGRRDPPVLPGLPGKPVWPPLLRLARSVSTVALGGCLNQGSDSAPELSATRAPASRSQTAHPGNTANQPGAPNRPGRRTSAPHRQPATHARTPPLHETQANHSDPRRHMPQIHRQRSTYASISLAIPQL